MADSVTIPRWELERLQRVEELCKEARRKKAAGSRITPEQWGDWVCRAEREWSSPPPMEPPKDCRYRR